jgi:CheY-like chemotaxis protein
VSSQSVVRRAANQITNNTSNALSKSQELNDQRTTAHYVSPTISKHHILCVDDDMIGTQLRGRILEDAGYSVEVCSCPIQALCCDLSLFSLAVVDFDMPALNGRELLLRMRAAGARFPIVLLSGFSEHLSHEDRVLFSRCLGKGRSIQCLLDTLAEFLSESPVSDFGSRRFGSY